jgi:putative spermidine/putrescine transport system substrate-binding protein
MSDIRKTNLIMPVSRRRLLQGAAAAGVVGLTDLRPALAQEPEKPKEMIVRVWGGVWEEAITEGVSKPFSEMTGIAIRNDLTEDNELQPKLWAAVDSNQTPPVHINWDTSTNAAKSALHGAAVDLGDLKGLDVLLPAAKPAGFDGWPMVNAYTYAYVLAYSDAAFPNGAPDSWQVLLDPKYKGRIALYDDGIGFHPAAQVAGGGKVEDIPGNMQPAWDFIAKLKEQAPLLGEDPDFTNWFQQGQIDLACTILSNAREAKMNGVKVSWTVPKEGCKLDTDALWVPKNPAENEVYWAKKYVEYAITAEAQQKWTAKLGLPPVYPGLTPPDDLVGDIAYPTKPEDFDRFIRVPTNVLVEHEKEWFAKFNEIMQG